MAKRTKSLELLEPILVKTFGLERTYKLTNLLNDWLSVSGNLNEIEYKILGEVIENLVINADSWNEEELKMQFISFVVHFAHFSYPIRTYYDREIGEIVEGIALNCKADMLLAKGIGEMIEVPYFFFHEYKREKKYSGDPVGQMLGGMLIGQAKNNIEKQNTARPIYGCYVQGRFWWFSILEGKKYTISPAFDSSNMEGASKIIFILRKLNTIILEKLMD